MADNENENTIGSLPNFFAPPTADDLRYQADGLRNEADTLIGLANLMDARDILPEVEIEIEGWNSLDAGQRAAYPNGQFTAELQNYLGVEPDGIFGFDTAQSLLTKLSEELSGGYEDAVIVDLGHYPNLAAHLENIAGQDFQIYGQAVEGYIELQEVKFAEALQQTAVNYYSTCQYQNLFFDPQQYIESFLQRIEEGADPEDALSQECDLILSGLDPDMRDAVKAEVFDLMNLDIAELYNDYRALRMDGIHDAAHSATEPNAPAISPLELGVPKL